MIGTYQGTPKEPGLYLWRTADDIKLIRVYECEAGYRYGAFFDRYLAVAEFCGTNVQHLRGSFSRPLELVEGALCEVQE